MKKVMVFGTFDILHPGHVHMLKEAKEYGDYLIVIVARDNTTLGVKGRAPINTENIRLKNLEKLGIANRVRLGHFKDKHQVLSEEKPDVVALGYDQRFFIDELEDALENSTKIIRLSPHQPKMYKSSKIAR